jgi:hypothetical protein
MKSSLQAPNGSTGFSMRLRIGVGVFLVLLVVSFFYSVNGQWSDYMPEARQFPSVRNRKASGGSGFYDLVKKIGKARSSWELPYRDLSKVSNGILVIVGPSEVPGNYDVDEILAWVAKGNDLIYLDGFTYRFERRVLDKLALEWRATRKRSYDQIIAANYGSPLFQHVDHLVVSTSGRLIDDGNIRALCKDKDGIVFGQVRHGQGRILLGCDAQFLANRHLADKDDWSNFQFLANWISQQSGNTEKTILFDERCHGFSTGGNIFAYALKGPVGFVVGQLFIILFIALIGSFQRFGTPETISRRRKPSNLEFLEGLKNTYRRAEANKLVADVIGRNFRLKLAKAVGVAASESSARIAQVGAENYGLDRNQVLKLLAQVEYFEKSEGKLLDQGVLAFAKGCETVSKEVELAKKERG